MARRRARSVDGFRPIKQVGVASSLGIPLIGIGVLMLIIAQASGGIVLWVAAGVLLLAGFVAGLSSKII
jgi:hypothetical protein